MNRARLPLWALMAMLVPLALGAALVRLPSPSPVLTSIVFTSGLTVLIVATLGAIRGPAQTFCLGFAVAGWIYWFLAFGPGTEATNSMLFTSVILDWIYDVQVPQPSLVTITAEQPAWLAERYYIRALADPWAWRRFQRIGHTLSALAHGLAGGLLLLALESWVRRKPVPETP